MHVMWRVIVAIAVLASVAEAQPMPDRTERLVGAARLWAKAKFFHPYLAYKDIDWDGAFVAAIPKIEAATTIDQYRAALDGMLAKLGDPVTRIGTPASTTTAAPGTLITTPAPNIVQIELAALVANGFDSRGFNQRGKEIETAASAAKILVVDLRSNQPVWITAAAITYFGGALPAIVEWPAQRLVEHRGFRSQETGRAGGGYFSTFITVGALPAGTPKSTGPKHVVFVTDRFVPVEALALQASGHATIVASGVLDPGGTVDTVDVALPGDLTATVRLGELLWGPPAADVVAKDPRARALALAKQLAAQKAPKRMGRPYASPRHPALPPLRVRDDDDYANPRYPSRELRLLAGIRIWATLDVFFPYRDLIADWDGVLREMLPRLEAASDRDNYLDVLREMSARAGDGHIGISIAGTDPTVKRRGTVGAYLRLVEGKLAVVRTVDAESAKALAPGDVIETVDGTPVAKLLAERRPTTSGSTAEARDQRIAYLMGFGDENTIAKLGVRDAKGKLREVSLPRLAANLPLLFEQPAGPHWKKLPNNVGYVNMMLFAQQEVPQMLDELKNTKALVLDLRGYAAGSMWTLAPRLNVKRAKHGAQFLRPNIDGTDGGNEQRIRFFQPISALAKDTPLYTGKIVVLIDDRAISHSEHTCLFLAEAAPVTFVGSPTHGANGDITTLRLPGGLRMNFTGQEVRWVDGRQLQRVGVQPHVTVRPTLAGLRAGKDEVLDRALVGIK